MATRKQRRGKILVSKKALNYIILEARANKSSLPSLILEQLKSGEYLPWVEEFLRLNFIGERTEPLKVNWSGKEALEMEKLKIHGGFESISLNKYLRIELGLENPQKERQNY